MFERFKLAFYLVIEAIVDGKLIKLFRQQVFFNRIATPAAIDLTQILPNDNTFEDTGYKFIEFTLNDLIAKKWSFAFHSRSIKAVSNIQKGLRGFAIVKDSSVIGDMWCVVPQKEVSRVVHPDLEMLGIVNEPSEVYAFDMLIDPQHRGKNLAVPLQRNLHITMKSEGYKNLYGYYWNDNIPAMWMHRMLKFKELPKRRVSRIFFVKWTEWID